MTTLRGTAVYPSPRGLQSLSGKFMKSGGFSALLSPVSAGSLVSGVFHVAFNISHFSLWKEWKQTLSVFVTILEGRLNFRSVLAGGWKVRLGVKRKLEKLFSSHCALQHNLLFPNRDTLSPDKWTWCRCIAFPDSVLLHICRHQHAVSDAGDDTEQY